MRFRFPIAALWLTYSLSLSVVNALPTDLDFNNTIVPREEIPKLVVSHFMVGNTFPYTIQEWTGAITLASSKGIDAFALDVGKDPWQIERIADAYKAATNTTFKLFMTFDMGSLPCATAEDAYFIRSLIKTYQHHPNQLLYNNKILVSSFGGQLCLFGSRTMDEGWNKTMKVDMPKVHFVPAYFIEPPIYKGLEAIDGAFAVSPQLKNHYRHAFLTNIDLLVDSSWPMDANDINSEYDDEYHAYLPGRTYMAGVSPWFFTHYSHETYNKNFMYRGDAWHFAARWEILFKNRDFINIVQVISWNDYGESHYIGPIDGAQPNSESWVNGFDHQGWLDLMQYYIIGFKTGHYPAITKDRVFLWGRLYPAEATTPDPVGKPINWDFTRDIVWGVVLMTDAGHLDLQCGPSILAVDLPLGMSKVQLPLKENCSVKAVITRDGAEVLSFLPPGYNFNINPTTYNFNSFVAASPA